MSSQSSQCIRYLTLYTGTIILPVITRCYQTQSHGERLYLREYLRQYCRYSSKGQYLCNVHTTPYTSVPSLMTSVTDSRLSVIIIRLPCQSLSETQYLSESTLHLTLLSPTEKGEQVNFLFLI